MKRVIPFFLLLLTMTSVNAKQTTQHVVRSGGNDVRISICSPSMFRVQLANNGSYSEDENWMVRKYDFNKVASTVTTNDTATAIKTDSLQIIIGKERFAITVKDVRGKVLYKEIPTQNYANDSTVSLKAVLQPDDHFFGFGERMDKLDQRGSLVKLDVGLGRGAKPAVGGKDILRANYCPVPFFMSTRGYGIFLHTPYATEWDMGWSSASDYTMKAKQGLLDYYFIYGPSFYDMVSHYTELTGRSPMLPRFAMGLHLGTYSGGTWKNEQQTSDRYPVELVKRMRSEGIPFDVFWLDSTWRLFSEKHGNGGCCFEWRNTFKDPVAMFKDVYAQHVAMMGLHIRSFLDNGPKYNLLDAAKKEGYVLYKDMDMVDFFNPKAVDWWFDNGVKKVADIGCKFVKTDCGGSMNDPEDPAMHNLYPLAYAEAPFLKFKELNKMRGLTHTREGYAGIQRYPYIWAGDWGTEWQWFEPLIMAGMNIGMSGVGNWTHCMGGFEQYSAYDTELYVRWCQFGMFSPIAMLFGMDHPRYHEPWTYGEEAMKNFIKYDSLRYTLIPYIYTAEYENHKSGRPLMTPLVMDFQGDVNTYNLTRQYMFGRWMMVCPVTTKGALSQWVYFPGGNWIDYNTGERISGRQYKSFLTPLDILPIYIKAGAIIPQQPAMQYYGEREVDFITFDVYPEGKSTYDMYDDDGVSDDYLKAKCAMTHVASELAGNTWSLSISKPEGSYKPREYGYKVKALLDNVPTAVTENGAALKKLSSVLDTETSTGWYYDDATHRLYVHLSGKNNSDIKLTTRLSVSK